MKWYQVLDEVYCRSDVSIVGNQLVSTIRVITAAKM
jgi:hypothetical protein